MSDPQSLLLTETGVEHLPGGAVAVNVGPIVRALKFLTEGRGDDRGIDEAGNPLPDLMSLAFSVVECIILGGRKADYFRQVMRDWEAQAGSGRSSLALAKEARRVQRAAPESALEHAAGSLEDLLAELREAPLEGQAAQAVGQALEAFRAFGSDRWVSASAQLLVALSALGVVPEREPATAPKRRRARAAKKQPAKVPKKRPAKAAKKQPAKAPKPARKARASRKTRARRR